MNPLVSFPHKNKVLRISLLILPVFFLSGFYVRAYDDLFEPISELQQRVWILFPIGWIAAGLITFCIVRGLRACSLNLSLLGIAILVIIFSFSCNTVSHALAEDWTLAHLKTSGLPEELAGTGSDWNQLYMGIPQNRGGILTIGPGALISSLAFGLVSALIWLPILLISYLVLEKWKGIQKIFRESPSNEETNS